MEDVVWIRFLERKEIRSWGYFSTHWIGYWVSLLISRLVLSDGLNCVRWPMINSLNNLLVAFSHNFKSIGGSSSNQILSTDWVIATSHTVRVEREMSTLCLHDLGCWLLLQLSTHPWAVRSSGATKQSVNPVDKSFHTWSQWPQGLPPSQSLRSFLSVLHWTVGSDMNKRAR